jgi:pilus assembly protein Flp/PilA
MNTFKVMMAALMSEEEGQGIVEYALILALVSVVAIGIMGTVGVNVNTVFDNAAGALTGAVAP